MAVPSSGTLSLIGLAREKQNDDYTDTTAMAGTNQNPGSISLESCATSGSNHSPQVVMEATNTSSPSYPNSSTPHAMSEFYSYDHDYAASTTSYRTAANQKFIVVCSYNTSAAIYTVGAIANSSTVYTDTARTTLLAAGNYAWHVNSNSATPSHSFTVDGSGVVSNWASC